RRSSETTASASKCASTAARNALTRHLRKTRKRSRGASERLAIARAVETAVGGAARDLERRPEHRVDFGTAAIAGVGAEHAGALAVEPHDGQVRAGEVGARLAVAIDVAAHADPPEGARRAGVIASARVEGARQGEALPAHDADVASFPF